MRNMFELTKREQRVVIVIVILLVSIAFAKHWFQTRSVREPASTSPSREKSSGSPSPVATP